MLLKTAALSVFIASVALAQPAPRSERDYWAETQLGFDATLNGEISDQTCYQQERVFRGCLAGLHAGLSVLRSYSSKGVLPGERGVLPGFIGSDAQGIKSNNKENALLTKRRKMMLHTESSPNDLDFQ